MLKFLGALDAILARQAGNLRNRVIPKNGRLGHVPLFCALVGIDHTIDQLQRPLAIPVLTRRSGPCTIRVRPVGQPCESLCLGLGRKRSWRRWIFDKPVHGSDEAGPRSKIHAAEAFAKVRISVSSSSTVTAWMNSSMAIPSSMPLRVASAK
ncbi:MAG: hypothetical protein F4X97_14430 [Boseongicola sp. SB0662_bin_57]|nr:hypothetical protein [Boseongicola sp. SB0662_bin_57]